jgi:hypothetical protein
MLSGSSLGALRELIAVAGITNHLIPDWKIMIIHFTYLNCDPTCSMSRTLFSSGDWLFVFFSSLGFSFTVVIKI